MPDSALTALRRRLDTARVRTDEAATFAASLDNLRLSFPPKAVVKVRREEEVGAVLQVANRYEVPVTVRGAGSGAVGGAVPVKGGWVLDLSALQAIRLDAERGLVYAQAGAVTGKIAAKAEAKGWFYPPDPSSVKYCTIGGNLACNAGGLRGAKYGVTRDYVLALEGYLPTGEFVRWGRDLRKYVCGYNMRDLWVGHEGTLGIITRAVLRCIPVPKARWTALFAFEDETRALTAVRALLARRIVPSICEFLDRQTVECTERLLGRTVFAGQAGRALVLLELDGHPGEVEDARAAVRLWANEEALAWQQAESPTEREHLWQARRSCSQAMFQLGDSKINEDIVVPPKSYTALLRFTRSLRRQTGLATPTFGHAADGNFHVHLMYNRGDPRQGKAAEKGVQKIFDRVVALDGAITGEHGIGLAKSPFLRHQLSKAEVTALRAIKDALDPRGILNPGKIFEPFRVWRHTPEKVTLPWDHR